MSESEITQRCDRIVDIAHPQRLPLVCAEKLKRHPILPSLLVCEKCKVVYCDPDLELS